MTCTNCDSQNVRYEIVEESTDWLNHWYVWEKECSDCGYFDTGYEF